MNMNVIIDTLMVYAQEYLLLDDLDVIYTRNKIIQRLRLDNYEEYEITADLVEGLQNPYSLLDQLGRQAVENGLISEDERLELQYEIMSDLIKLPSVVDDTFNELVGQQKVAKAFSWLNEYNFKSGYIKSHNILKHWEAKGTKGKIELFIARKDQEPKHGDYPHCLLCHDIDGLGKYRLLRRSTLLLGNSYFSWQLEENPYVSGLGYVIPEEHTVAKVNSKWLNHLFDFVDLTPTHFVAMEESKAHGSFIAAVKPLPIHKMPEIRKYKSAQYPYISIAEIDWYSKALRISCTNREKLVEFVEKLSAAFSELSPSYKLSVSVRKSDKYVLDIVFDNDEAMVSEKNRCLFEKRPDMLARMGCVVLDEALNEEMVKMYSYLTREIKYDESELASELKKYKHIIVKILKEIGNTKISIVEAQIDLKEEINNICEATLTEIAPFQDTPTAFEDFLNTLDIK